MEGREVPPDQPADASSEAQEPVEDAASRPPWRGFETDVAWRGLRRRRTPTPRQEEPPADESPAEGFAINDEDATVTERPDGRG